MLEKDMVKMLLDRIESLAFQKALAEREGNETCDRLNRQSSDHYRYRQAAEEKVRALLHCIDQHRDMLRQRKVLTEKLPPIPSAEIAWETDIPF